MTASDQTDREFSALLEKWLGNLDTFALPVETRRFFDHMREEHQELLEAWIDRHLLELIRLAMERRLRTQRAQARRRGAARAFRRAAGIMETTGDPTPLGRFRREVYSVDGAGTRKVVGLMTADDHLWVAGHHGHSGRKLLMLEAFHRAVAHRLGDRTTEEVFSEEEYDRLYLSIVE